MFMVYWTKIADGERKSESMDFDSTEMSLAMKLMEQLRGDPTTNRFITMCSENPNSVGKAGAADPTADYNWTKRRGNMPHTRENADYTKHKDF